VASWSEHMAAPDYDQPIQPTELRYIICGAPRSGTSLLCSYLYNVGAGVPMEYFDEQFVGPMLGKRWFPSQQKLHIRDYIKALHENRTRNQIFGAKVLWHQFGDRMDGWHESYPDTKYIWVHRRDLIQQSVSAYIAQALDYWSTIKGDSDERPNPPPYNFLRIDNMRLVIQEQNYNWDLFFEDKEFWPVAYEDLIKDPAREMAKVMHWFEDPLPQPYKIGEPKTKKIRDKIDMYYCHKYRNDLHQIVDPE